METLDGLSVVVLISSTRKDQLKKVSLPSVLGQTRNPDAVYIVADKDEGLPKNGSEGGSRRGHVIRHIVNRRTKNLSGALNTGLSQILVDGFDPNRTFIAILDDDDWWEESYLADCLENALSNRSDWVISGIIRHEREGQSGKHLSVPNILNETLFLSGNPHVQGSNLFVRLSSLLLAGGFDEYLPSTTDRDICIRLLRLGNIRYSGLLKHMVHHSAFGKQRLSEAGSSVKCTGLNRFYWKYKSQMSQYERSAFIKRSRELFDCEIGTRMKDQEKNRDSTPRFPPQTRDEPNLSIVVGAIASSFKNAVKLFRDTYALQMATGKIAGLVVLENFSDESKLIDHAKDLLGIGVKVLLVSQEAQEKTAERGSLGPYYFDVRNRKGIPYGRTLLHRFVYEECLNYQNPVAWIVDDDVSLMEIYWGSQDSPLSGEELNKYITGWKAMGISIVVGRVGGDPPVPAMATMRTQLLDLHFNLTALIKGTATASKKERLAEFSIFTREFPDYHYDFPSYSYGHLEFPACLPGFLKSDDPRSLLNELLVLAPQIVQRSVFRPAEYPMHSAYPQWDIYEQDGNEFGPVRGGNTIVLDVDSLRTFFNGSPHSSGLSYRRGDTLWTLLNRRLGSSRPIGNPRVVISAPLMLIQHRDGDESPEEMQEKLVSDSLGSAFTKTLDRFISMKMKEKQSSAGDFYSALAYSKRELQGFYADMQQEVNRRAELILLNAWRIKGLLMSIMHSVNQLKITSLIDSDLRDHVTLSMEKLVNQINYIWNASAVAQIVDHVRNFNKEDLFAFLKTLEVSNREYSESLPIHYSEEEISKIRKETEKIFDIRGLNLLSSGKEGVILGDGTNCYKYFHNGKSGLESSQINFLKESLLGKSFSHIAELIEMREAGDSLVLKEEFVKGEHYHGGRLSDLNDLLRECKTAGIVLNNIAPKNLKVSGDNLKFVDIGRDITAYSEEGYLRMCRRVYLTYRWHFRDDLPEILRRSIRETDFPELFGFQWFMQGLEVKTNRDIIIPDLLEILRKLGPKTVLDYGCGNGGIGDILSRDYSVAVYDINMQDFWKRHNGKLEVEVLEKKDLDMRKSTGDQFDLVLLNLVLCSVGDTEVREIIKDSRKLVKSHGNVVVTICNPFNIGVHESQTCRLGDHAEDYGKIFQFEKTVKFTNRTRIDYHRPLRWYISELGKNGFQISDTIESEGVSVEEVSPGSDFLFIVASPVPESTNHDVSLLIKASSMEWRTIGFQVRHIVSQLEGPEIFREKIVVTDDATSGFLREYASADLELFHRELEKLKEEGVVDRVLFSPSDAGSLEEISERWFGVKTSARRSENGQQVLTTLFGFENTNGKYVLQMDSDCIIGGKDGKDGYIDRMVRVFEENNNAVTVSFPVYTSKDVSFDIKGGAEKWRTEVRNCMLHMERLRNLLPLPNSISNSGKLSLPWHRSLDARLSRTTGESYRGSEGDAYFVHVPNTFKKDINEWYQAIWAVENGFIGKEQSGKVDLIFSSVEEVLPCRNEEMVIIVKGRDVPIPKVRRCFDSLLSQEYQNYGVIAIDAGSSNGMAEYLDEIVMKLFPERFSLFRNIQPLTSMENIHTTISKFCCNPNSIIVLLDADDALISPNSLCRVIETYGAGSDLTVGTMLRTDKKKSYPVDFLNPRKNRGGNVWQHLRSFRKYLFDAIDVDDFKLDGGWVEEADDWAYMLPAVEIADHPAYIPEEIYFYEPSREKTERDRDRYEDTIRRIVSKKSYKKESTA